VIGTVEEIVDQLYDRRERLGLTYHVLLGATPEELAPVLSRARAG
jgi:hypothetical protein